MAPGREMTCLQAHIPDWNAGLPAAGPVFGKCSGDFIGSCERLGSGNRKTCCFLVGPSEPLFPHPYNRDHKRMIFLPLGWGRFKWLQSMNSLFHRT